MRRILLSTLLFLLTFTVLAQDKYTSMYNSLDPSYQYIKKYGPEYYYESYILKGSPKKSSLSDGDLSVEVRVLHNFVDDKTFSFYLLYCDERWETLFVNEVDSLIVYLERVLTLMDDEKANRYYHYMYNSKRGVIFKTQWDPLGPYMTMYFPEGKNFDFTNKKQVQSFINQLVAGKEHLPAKESEFHYD